METREWYTPQQLAELMQDTADNITYLCRQAHAQGKYKDEIVKIGRKWRINISILKSGGIQV